ncbi:hypothetical protein DFQ28_009709 [Apophysomyces sp. BC1034]
MPYLLTSLLTLLQKAAAEEEEGVPEEEEDVLEEEEEEDVLEEEEEEEVLEEEEDVLEEGEEVVAAEVVDRPQVVAEDFRNQDLDLLPMLVATTIFHPTVKVIPKVATEVLTRHRPINMRTQEIPTQTIHPHTVEAMALVIGLDG